MPDRGQALHAAVGRIWDSHLQAVQDMTLLAVFKTLPEVAGNPCRLRRRGGHASYHRSESRPGWPASAKDQVCRVRTPVLRTANHRQERAQQCFLCGRVSRGALEGQSLTKDLERVLIVHRLREVTALVGYTRFDYISPDIDGEFDLNLRPARLGVNSNWIPADRKQGRRPLSSSSARMRWINGSSRPAVKEQAEKLERGLQHWCLEQDIQRREFFGAPYVMLHSLSHLLINAISLECGYPAASIKERIYANEDQGYGILLYTACADSLGTLGGLANAAKSIDHYLKMALEMGAIMLE